MVNNTSFLGAGVAVVVVSLDDLQPEISNAVNKRLERTCFSLIIKLIYMRDNVSKRGIS
jgi:hypothetical protein